MPQVLLDKFEKQHGIKVIQDTYDRHETLLAKLKSGVKGYDVAIPGDYMVAIMIKEGLLEKIDAHAFSHFKNIKKEMIDVYFDPGRQYSIPYQVWDNIIYGQYQCI